MKQKRVVVTGLGALTPLGNTVTEFWNNLISGKSGAAAITRFDTSRFRTKFACEVKGFDPLDYLDRTEVRKMDPFTQYAVVCSDEELRKVNDVAGFRRSVIYNSVTMRIHAGEHGGPAWGTQGRGHIRVFYMHALPGHTVQARRFKPRYLTHKAHRIIPMIVRDNKDDILLLRKSLHNGGGAAKQEKEKLKHD